MKIWVLAELHSKLLFPQSFKFGDISEINENISFLSSLVNAQKIIVFQRYACREHARTRVRGHRDQRATQSYILKKSFVIAYDSSVTAVQYCN